MGSEARRLISSFRRKRYAPRSPPSNVTRGSRKVTGADVWNNAVEGRFQPSLRRERYAGSVYRPQNSELLAYLAQIERSFAGSASRCSAS